MSPFVSITSSLLPDGLRLTFKPVPSPFVILKEVMGLLPDLCMVVIYPFYLSIAQIRWLN